MIEKNQPLVKMIIHLLSSGDILDEVALNVNITSGDITGSLSSDVEEKLLTRKGLNGAKVIAATTSDLNKINEIIAKGNRTVVHQIPSNSNLTFELAKELADLAVMRKDSNLAMSLFRHRRDIGFLLKHNNELLGLVSFKKKDKPIYNYLPLNIGNMNLAEIEALASFQANTDFPGQEADGIALCFSLMFTAFYKNQVPALDLASISFIIDKYKKTKREDNMGYYPSLVKLLSSTPNFKNIKVSGNPQSSSAHYFSNSNEEHMCDNEAIAQLHKATFSKDPTGSQWDEIAVMLTSYNDLSYTKKRAIFKKADIALRREIITHDSRFLAELLNHERDNLIVKAEDMKAMRVDAQILRLILDNLSKGKDFRGDYVSKNLQVFIELTELSIRDYYWLLVTLVESDSNFRAVRKLLSGLTLEQVVEVEEYASLSKYSSNEINKNLRYEIYSIYASDPFLDDSLLPYVMELPLKIINPEQISFKAKKYVAKEIMSSGSFSFKSLEYLSALNFNWEGSYKDLAKASIELQK